MDNNIESALAVIKKNPEILVEEIEEFSISFKVKNARFCLWLYSKDYNHNDKMPILTGINLTNSACPHLLTKEIEIFGRIHHRICLYEEEFIVKSLFTSCEKIEFVILQLLRLTRLNLLQQNKEYHKEFLMYWNNAAKSKNSVDLFINSSNEYSWLNVYYPDQKNHIRIANSDLFFNDEDKKTINKKVRALYIPITDTREIFPPTNEKNWEIDDVLNVIKGKQIRKISDSLFDELVRYNYSWKSIFLVFEMPINESSVAFCCEIIFKNAGTMKLLKKIESNVQSINVIETNRYDYEFLNKQIGNDLALMGKKVAVIGIGSLGSYIANEIVKIGVNKITLIDKDILYPENIMRHRSTFFWHGFKKNLVTKVELEYFHPQVEVVLIDEFVSYENVIEILPADIDLVIFAVGNSDVQLASNRKLKEVCFSKPVLFCWLEANRNVGHVLGIDYSKPGCYQCLFTDKNGNWINNKVNIIDGAEVEKNIIHNGCGGTRIAYGNASLLLTTYMTLDAIKIMFSNSFESNFLISFDGNHIMKNNDSFQERSCACCHGDSV